MNKNTKIIDHTNSNAKTKKPIEFCKQLTLIDFVPNEQSWLPMTLKANEFQNIELIVKEYVNGYDLMFVYYDGRRREGVLVAGHFNDGIV
jgi:hypothetical protein